MRKFKEEWKTWGNVFDRFTEQTILKLMGCRYLDGLASPLKIGKEANVFIAEKDGKEIVCKIYRVSACDFKKMYSYIRTDPRFGRLDKRRRQVIFAWTQREFRNLLLAREAGVHVPVPHVVRNHVLVMDMVGKHEPAQQLNVHPPANPEKFFKQVVRMMKKLHKARIVHADLSAYNILNDDEKPVFIDMSQSTSYDNPNYKEYFDRDVRNMARFFSKQGVEITEKELKDMITDD